MAALLREVFSRRVRELRKAKGLTQSELASRSGLEQSRISDIERGAMKEPQIDHLQQVAEGLGVAPSSLITEETIEPTHLTESELALVHAWRMGRATGVLTLIAPHLKNK